MRKFFVILATIVATVALSGCATTDPRLARQAGSEAGYILGSAAKGAAVGALIGAGASSDRTEGAQRGALIGAGVGLATAFVGGGNPYYRSGIGAIPDHCRVYPDFRRQNICAQSAYRELEMQRRRTDFQAVREAQARGRSWRY